MAICNDVVGCPDCGLIKSLPELTARGALCCPRCDAVLERNSGRSLDGALACALATLLLLVPANFLPLLQVEILDATNRSVIASGVWGIWQQHWPLVAGVVGLEIVLLPFLRFGLLTAVLLAVRLGKRSAWIGPAFRWSEHLDQWAMTDVFLFGGIVGYSRVAPFLPIQFGAGDWCLIAAALLTLVTRATLGRRAIWRRIGPVAAAPEAGMIGCSDCDFPAPAGWEGRPCPRCGARIWPCRPYSAMRAVALTLAACAFYPAAYLFPMEYSVQLGTSVGYSVMTGVGELVKAHLWFFAGLIFVASVLIPLLKLFAFAWFGFSIHRHSPDWLRLKTKLYRIVDRIGRWSHIDVFTVSLSPVDGVAGLPGRPGRPCPARVSRGRGPDDAGLHGL